MSLIQNVISVLMLSGAVCLLLFLLGLRGRNGGKRWSLARALFKLALFGVLIGLLGLFGWTFDVF
jgi:hypothetical protein